MYSSKSGRFGGSWAPERSMMGTGVLRRPGLSGSMRRRAARCAASSIEVIATERTYVTALGTLNEPVRFCR